MLAKNYRNARAAIINTFINRNNNKLVYFVITLILTKNMKEIHLQQK